ncbi:MAG: sterol desaturase family protein [Sphingobacteriaceae bacterium]
MDLQRINNKGQARIFNNEILESLSKTRPWVIYAIYIPLCAALLTRCYTHLGFSISFIATLFLIAMFSWTLFEYIAHRYLFHFNASSSLGQRIVYIFHGNHHEYPRDKERLFMPPLPSILAAIVMFSIFYEISLLITGTGNYAFVFFPGFIIGYLIYVSMHYAIHAFAPPKLMKGLWRNHHLHHYKYPEKGFGVSSTLWDRVFGTMQSKQRVDE